MSTRSAPAAAPMETTSLYKDTAVSNGRSPSGFKSFPVGPRSRATYPLPASSTAFLALAIAASTMAFSSPSLSYFNRLAPKVLVVIISAPAARYFLCTSVITSGWEIFQRSGSSPAASPAACSRLPIPPSQYRRRTFISSKMLILNLF